VIRAGSAFSAMDYTPAGERIGDNSFWYRDANSNFLWAGTTNIPNPA